MSFFTGSLQNAGSGRPRRLDKGPCGAYITGLLPLFCFAVGYSSGPGLFGLLPHDADKYCCSTQETARVAETTPEKTDGVEPETHAPCRVACPVRTDTRGYVDLIARGRYREAFEKIRQANPFPSVCALICHHPCEVECRRQDVDDPVALRHLKRFAVEQAREYRERARHAAEITHSETIGVVGSGPAGLTVAHDCINEGYAVTVYESLPRAGGLLSCSIPKYRLPEEALTPDLEDILALGVEIRTGVTVGEDVTLQELQEKHEAVVLAVGLSESRDLPLENHDHPDVLMALPFLCSVALGRPPQVRDEVIVIGGGNVAVDVARTCVRLGAGTVRMICLENEEEMPAWEWESREALEEGIEIIHRRGPTKVLIEEGRIVGVTVREVERVFDEKGRFAPTYHDDRLSTVAGQMIIVAIGQRANLDLLGGTPVRLAREGMLQFDAETMTTSEGGIFACGEVVTGPGSAIEAVASGHRAARAVLGYLRTGRAPVVEEEKLEAVEELPRNIIEKVKSIPLVAMPTLSPEERKRSFVQFELGYGEKDALAEARRCLSCAVGAVVDEDRCAACLTCARICPFEVPVVDEVARMVSETCQSCGLCVAECPASCITIKRFQDVGEIADRIVALLQDAGTEVTRVEIVCSRDAETKEKLQDRIVKADGEVLARVPVTCAALAGEVDMMKPFELGVKAVLVRRCRECLYNGASKRLAKRVGRTKEILDAAGVGGERLTLE